MSFHVILSSGYVSTHQRNTIAVRYISLIAFKVDPSCLSATVLHTVRIIQLSHYQLQSVHICSITTSYCNNVTTPDYITLPVSLNELNDYMCGPLNRKGLLCSECADGFGYSLSSFSYKCVNCTYTWYNIPVYLVAQFVPTTILYIVILVFRLSAISPPMPCFIMYAQLVVFGFDLSTHYSFGYSSKDFIYTEKGNVKSNVKIIDSFYGLFNQMDNLNNISVLSSIPMLEHQT